MGIYFDFTNFYLFIQELAFALLHAAANPGSNQNDRPLTSEELRPFLAFMQQGLQSKDVGTSTACLKFVVAVTQQSKSVVDFMLEFTDFVELVWKRCQLYVRMRSQPCYSLACHALRNLINQASTYNKFTTERIKTMCLFFKVNQYIGWPQSFMYFIDGRSLLQDIPQCFFIQQVP